MRIAEDYGYEDVNYNKRRRKNKRFTSIKHKHEFILKDVVSKDHFYLGGKVFKEETFMCKICGKEEYGFSIMSKETFIN